MWDEHTHPSSILATIPTRDWVLKHQPWIFKGSLFAIKKFTEQSSVNVTIEHASFWARIYDVPSSCMKESSLRLISKQIGILESVDILGEDLIGKFIRLKVSMNITKPLLKGITIWVKGKHLWLPLKYESLSIYSVITYVVNLLLLIYKSVCKLWKATISDPRFGETHLKQYKNSYSRNLLAWENYGDYYEGLYVAEIQKDHFKFVAGIQHSKKYSLDHGFLCNYDGLYLKCFDTPDEGKLYLLWNPSCRAYKEIWCPLSIDDSNDERALYGIYYNPLVKDYRVLIGDQKHYAVFSCRYNKWSEVKDMKDFSYSNKAFYGSGVCHNGSLYWRIRIESVGKTDDFEIIYFDWNVEKFNKLPMPDFKEKPDWLNLNSS
ncbi:hypothetical protein ACS0TY_022093 [Phlomoides rotata]